MWTVISELFCITLLHVLNISSGANVLLQNRSQNHAIKSLGQRNLEAAIRFYDKDLFQASVKIADELNIIVRGYYHVSAKGKHWDNGFEESLLFMDGKRFQANMFPHVGITAAEKKKQNKLTLGWSSVFSVVDKVNVLFYGDTLQYTNLTTLYNSLYMSSGLEKVNITHVDSSVERNTEWEEQAQSINDLHAFCSEKVRSHQPAFVFFVHNKEPCDINSQRGYMQQHTQLTDVLDSFLLEYPAICMAALIGGYGTCGVDFSHGSYSNNMWWARCDHVASLRPIDLKKFRKSSRRLDVREVKTAAQEKPHLRQRPSAATSANTWKNAKATSFASFTIPSSPELNGATERNSNSALTIKRAVLDFLYNQVMPLNQVTSTASSSSSERRHHHHRDEHFSARCAYNFRSENNHQHHSNLTATDRSIDHSESLSSQQCSARDSFRFQLMEVLSRLHDDGWLVNNVGEAAAAASSSTSPSVGSTAAGEQKNMQQTNPHIVLPAPATNYIPVHLTDHTKHILHRKCT